MKERIKKINNLLVKQFGIPHRPKKLPNPVDTLIATILSQNTNDKNSFQAYQNLKKKYQSWNLLASASLKQIEKDIRVAGLARQKSVAIKKFLMKLYAADSKFDLSNIKEKKDDEILSELTSFNRIGIKTASCVLLFSLDRNVCPVDTHVHRTLNRIGLVKTSSPDKTFYLINKNLPEAIAHQFHTNLIRLGREICKPAKPLCSICPLVKFCNYESKNFQVTNNYSDKAGMFHKQKSFMLLDAV